MKDAPLLNLVLVIILVILVGWLLIVGRTVLLPIVTAVISVYVLVSASDALRRLPFVGRLPTLVLRAVVLAAFTATLLGIASIVTETVREITAVAPVYQENLSAMLDRTAMRLNLERHELWEQLQALTTSRIDLQGMVLGVLGGFTSLGATVFLTVVYAAFLLSERGKFEMKTAAAFPDRAQAARILGVVSSINGQIRNYITVKTAINIILGLISYVILEGLGTDFAPFWALMIGLLNYIPYVGSYIAVALPVLLSLAQFGDLARSLLLGFLLTAVQMLIGNFLEPRMIGRQLNLSPFVVLVSLSIWASIWGVPGAILAVPMTSILVIVLASFDATRPAAILLANRTSQTPEAAPRDG
jgi:AI-2 transport protein TqsA